MYIYIHTYIHKALKGWGGICAPRNGVSKLDPWQSSCRWATGTHFLLHWDCYPQLLPLPWNKDRKHIHIHACTCTSYTHIVCYLCSLQHSPGSSVPLSATFLWLSPFGLKDTNRIFNKWNKSLIFTSEAIHHEWIITIKCFNEPEQETVFNLSLSLSLSLWKLWK